MTNTQRTYTPDMMRTELLPSYAGDIQQKIADVSDMLFGIQQNRTLDRGMSMLGLAAKQLKIHGLSRYRSEIGSISYARITDQADAADKEAQKMSEGFQTIFTELYKENILLDTLRAMLDENIKELGFASAALTKHARRMKAMGAAHMTGGGDPFYDKLGYGKGWHTTYWKREDLTK